MSYASYFAGAAWRLRCSSRSDQIVSLATPPLLPLLGRMAQLMRGARHVIWEMDVYPDVAVELGVIRQGSVLERTIGWLADWPRRKADLIIVLGPCMRERLIRRGIAAERIVIAENWADGRAIRPQPFQRDGRLKLLYSGNFGLAHEFDTICEALFRLADESRFAIQFNGAGPRRTEVETACRKRGVRNCTFGVFEPIERVGEKLAACDIGLVTQRQGTAGTVVPSKAYAILAAGRPLLYIGPASSTTARMILESGCGWHIENGKIEALVALLELLQRDVRLVEEAGRLARSLFEKNYDLPLGVERVLRMLGCKQELRPSLQSRTSTGDSVDRQHR